MWIHTASTPCLARLPTSRLNTQWLRHFLSLASPSNPAMLLRVVLTVRPSKCIHSNGAGLFGFTVVRAGGEYGCDVVREGADPNC